MMRELWNRFKWKNLALIMSQLEFKKFELDSNMKQAILKSKYS